MPSNTLGANHPGPQGLLSPAGYDDDASSIHSRSDQDTDSDDDQLQMRARNSRELRAADRIVLMEEEELDRLVTTTRQQQERQRRGSGLSVPNPLRMFGRHGGSSSQQSSPSASVEDLVSEKRRARRSRRRQKRQRLREDARHGEDGELMYEMEEGGVKDGSSTGDGTDRENSLEEAERRRRLDLVAPARRARVGGRGWPRWLLIRALVAVGLSMLALVAWKLSRGPGRRLGTPPGLVSNGTALFGPTTIILSLDGFRADFLHRGLTPRLSAFVREGVSPQYMEPSFPSLTFPNHYTLATGLYPEAHGIVGNSFWDPVTGDEFHYTDPARSLDAKWWGGEPFWVSAERQGVRTAVHMWPGSEARIHDMFASFVDRYNGKEPLDKKVARILGLLDLPGKESAAAAAAAGGGRPQLIAAYVPNVDTDGHKYGPNSTETRATIQRVDAMLDDLFAGLERRNLTDIVNVMVVSDHGMATTDASRLVQLEDLVDTSAVEHTDGWPLYGLRPKDDEHTQALHRQLRHAARSNPSFDVYLRDVDMPARYHFANNPRIAPLWIVPKTGWAIVTRDEFDVHEAKGKALVYHPRGLHGYDNQHPLMRAIFIARGPAFPHPANSRLEPFQNINVYNILCDSLHIQPRPNNGTLRLPLKPVGVHDAAAQPELPDPPPPALSASQDAPGRASAPTSVAAPPQPTSGATPDQPPASSHDGPGRASSSFSSSSSSSSIPVAAAPPGPASQAASAGADAAAPGDASSIGDRLKGWWGWLADKLGHAWDSITGSAQ
ncbi:uncharacterized protein UV8b_02284 [Ustilaginoidea virens]|uniref:Uncharacterized protein n=1 Tax=Ustilaginoidea virens TaxID=1159556 RepID=A0A063BTJ1_USTVR|nr:uncharacterized protein UV8b_02284 [Ustilaginoidea virens]QUC18043.1 hypothetical protein UV8b_02284 [Ustilaginoidea virens]GAO16064.1 hypothetical protein UVI_02054090 [Ustilaginoidea virens]